jgi:hypothetical protein
VRIAYFLEGRITAPEKNVKEGRGNLLLDLLPDARGAGANNVFDSIPQRRLYHKIPRDPQSDGMTWRIFRILFGGGQRFSNLDHTKQPKASFSLIIIGESSPESTGN